MRMYDIIHKKRNGGELSGDEIRFFVEGYTNGSVPDYQAAAFCMAVYFQGMTEKETSELTLAMAESGDQIDLSGIDGFTVDKHSTGGVGDKTSLIVAPIVATCGGKVAKMSGRGLGNTGGTIDKLESIKGFRTKLSEEEFIDNIKEIGLALTGQTGNLAPADKKIYALRDVTAIVDSIPLIASSIMSKKIAAGAGAIVLDVKVGSGAFMKNMQDAEKLAEEMVKIGSLAGRNTIAVISDMDEPLGLAVGNALEVAEAVKTLKKEGPEDLINLCLELGTQMLIASKVEENADKARGMLQNSIDDGSAYNKFLEFIKRQGGDITVFDDLDEFTECNYKIEVKADKEGYVQRIESELIGEASMILGGGRMTKEDVIQNIGSIARSGTKAFLEKIKQEAENKKESGIDLIGQFGVGFYSAFMVADNIIIETKNVESDKGVKWESSGDGSYSIEDIDKADRGTNIILKLKPKNENEENEEDYSNRYTLERLIQKYSNYVHYPIIMDMPIPKKDEKEESASLRNTFL
mgnify:CR=1 FL=1